MDGLIQINFWLNVLWGLLFKCSIIGFGTAMGFGDTWWTVIAVRWDVQVVQYDIATCSYLSSWISYYGYTGTSFTLKLWAIRSIQRCSSCVWAVELVVHAQHLLEISVTTTRPCHVVIQIYSLVPRLVFHTGQKIVWAWDYTWMTLTLATTYLGSK